MRFSNQTISATVQEIIDGKSSCKSTVQRSLDLIDKEDTTLQSFVSTLPKQAIDQAIELDNLPDDIKKSKPLLGIPIAVKDNICTKGISTTCSSKMLENFVPPYNASVIDFLLDSGAVIVGKTNLDEFAMGSSTENSHFFTTRNPANLNKIPGGSSGGSAAAVGAGFVPAALGSDTGGSIRQPCSHCGVVGLKPTYGRISRYGLVAFASSLDQIGPITSDVRDAGLLLEVLSKKDQRDSTYAHQPFINSPQLYNKSVEGLKIGIPSEYFGDGLSDEVKIPIMNLLESLKNAGAQTINISLPNVKFAIATYYIICTAEASSNLARYDGVKYGFRSDSGNTLVEMYSNTRKEGFGSEVKRRIMLGTYVLSSGYYDAYYLKAAKVRSLIINDFNSAFKQCDVIISPVSPTPAFDIGEKIDDPLQMYLTDIYTVSANLAGIPGISIPCGTPGDLPVGVQFMAPQWREDLLFKVGYASQCVIENA